MPEVVLSIWTITAHPIDYPDDFVARRHEILRGVLEPQVTGDVRIARTVDGVRAMLPPGLACIGREPNDEPHIVESWL